MGNEMKTILITGATGFLGSHLTHRLWQSYRVVILKRSFSDTWRINDILKNIRVYNIDCVELKRVFEENQIDTVMHTATNYGRQGENVSDIVRTNLLFPLQLFELAISFNVHTFFNTDTIGYKYLNDYTLSKKQFLEWLKQYYNKIRVINMKLEHIYGPKDDENKFITFLIRRMMRNETIDLTAGEQKRDFIYIDDVIHAFVKVLETESLHNEYEVGSGDSISIKKFVRLIHRLTESSSTLNFGALSYRENEIMESHADISKLTEIGWQPFVSSEDGIMRIIKNEKEHYASHQTNC